MEVVEWILFAITACCCVAFAMQALKETFQNEEDRDIFGLVVDEAGFEKTEAALRLS